MSAILRDSRRPPHFWMSGMMMSAARFSSSSRKPWRRYRFSPQQIGVEVDSRMSRMASTFSGGHGLLEEESLKGSASFATRLPVVMS
jgi:hypothetical protein